MAILLLSRASFATGIPVTDIPRLILEFITNQVLMEKDQIVQADKLRKLVEVLLEAKQIRARHVELRGMDEDLEKELRLVGQVKNLQLHDVLRISEKAIAVTNELYAEDLPFLEEYALFKDALRGIEGANEVYDFMVGNASLYGEITGRAPATYQASAELLQQQALRQYGVEVDAAKRALHAALSYQQLSVDLREQAADLSEKINTEGSWSMKGIGDLFSDLLDVGGDIPGLEDLFDLSDKVKDWSANIRRKAGLGDADNLFGGGKDKSDQIGEAVQEVVGGFDFASLLQTAIGLLGGGTAAEAPAYAVEFEKEGLRLTTGERIETQSIALDNLEQSLELQLEADRLVTEALDKSEHQHKVDQAYGNALFRKSLLEMPFTP
jgi:hypothetical protein